MTLKKALIIFIRNPESGKVKTRLSATIGNDQAFSIYKKLVEHTITVSKSVDADKFVFYSSHIDDNDEWDNKYFAKRLQTGSDLGERMSNAFKTLFADGYNYISIIGSDCPGITRQIIEEAFNALPQSDVAIGPAKDGGYYLLALNKARAELFNNISWSTDRVLSQTLAVCDHLNLSAHLLCELFDVDVQEDISDLEEFLSGKF